MPISAWHPGKYIFKLLNPTGGVEMILSKIYLHFAGIG